MKRLFTILTTIAISLTAVHTIQAESADLNITGQEKKILYDKGEYTRYFFSGESPEYFLKTSFLKDLESQFNSLSPNIGVESVFFYKTDKDISVTEIYNILLSVRTMKGIEYYSASRKKMRTLFTESYVIKSKEDPVPIPDLKVTRPERKITLYVNQKDKTFGRNIYRTDYRSDGKVIWVRMTNETSMKYKFIKMVDPGNISINLFVTKTDGGILFYGITGVKTFSFFGLEKAKKESFYNRIKAMYGWFITELESRGQ